ncbi:adenosylcobinamide-GDP ribazoletransferase [Chloroflexota bacterium]
MRFLAAIKFLTIIPLPWYREVSPEEVGRSIGYFPVVGLIIGLVLAGLNWLMGLFLPPAMVNVLLIIFLVMMSGGLHLDGFIDTCDGIAGHKAVEVRWEVMRDSRVGSFGVIGVFCLLLLKYASLNTVPEHLMVIALVIMPVVSRWAMVYAVFVYPYARPSGLGKVFKQEARWYWFTMATVITVAVAFIVAEIAGLIIMLGIWIVTVVVAFYLKRKFSGLTGDNYGAINQVAEVCVLIIVILLARLGLI